MFKTLTFTNLYNLHETSRSMLVMKSLISTTFFNFHQVSVYLKPIAFISSTFNELKKILQRNFITENVWTLKSFGYCYKL